MPACTAHPVLLTLYRLPHSPQLENPDLRSAFRMAASQKGVMVRRVEPTSAASEVSGGGRVLACLHVRMAAGP